MPGNPVFFPAASYGPDMPDYNDEHTDTVLNVIPRTPKTYGPLNSPAVFSSAALAKRCQGAFFGLDSSGNVNGFAGDAKDLYQMTAASSSTWTVVSKSAAAYGISAGDQWEAALYQQRVVITNIADPVQSFLLGTDTKFSDMIVTSNAPKAKFVATIKSFLVLGNTSDAIYGAQPQRVWWSRNGNPTSFDDPTSAIAAQFETSYQDLLGDYGQIQGIVGNLGTADGAVFMEHAIWRMIFSGSPDVFQFFVAEGVRGTPASGSIAQLGAMVYYLGEDGFYVFDGTNSRPIGVNRVDKTFFADLDQQYFGSISAAIDPINRLYLVAYPGAGHVGANANKLLIYNWAIDRWSTALPLQAGFELIFRALSFGYTLDQLYTILGYTLDNLPYPLDSRVWTGGSLLLGLFDTGHKLNFFTGSSLAATIDSSEQQPSPGKLTRVFYTRPIIDGSATPSVAVAARNRQVDPITFNVAVPMNSIGSAPQRAVGRYIRTETTIPAAQSWTHYSGVELEGKPAGVR